MLGFKKKLRAKAAFNHLFGCAKTYPIDTAGGRDIIGTVLIIQGKFSEVFNVLSSYFREELKDKTYQITRMEGGGPELKLGQPNFTILKTEGSSGSGSEQTNIDVNLSPVQLTEKIGPDFTNLLTKACNNVDFNSYQTDVTGFAIREYFCRITHK